MDDMTVSDPVRNIADLVRRAARRSGAGRALIFRDTVLSWAELDSRVDQTAATLRGLGLAEGERLGVALPNGLDFPIVYLGALRAGLVVLPINPGYTARELAHVLRDSGTVAIVGGPGVLAEVEDVRSELPALAHLLAPGPLVDAAAGARPSRSPPSGAARISRC